MGCLSHAGFQLLADSHWGSAFNIQLYSIISGRGLKTPYVPLSLLQIHL